MLELAQQYDLDALKARDLLQEYGEFEKLIGTANSPLVFSHIDFRGSNIMVTEPEQKLLTIDMEYCAFAPRAFDMATFLSEWGKELFDYENLAMPEDEVIGQFVALYLEGCDLFVPGYSSKPENGRSVIVREVKLFILANIMFITAMSAKQEEAIIEAVPFNPLMKMVSGAHIAITCN